MNIRLQPFQAIVGSRVLDTVKDLVAARGRNAARLDDGLGRLPQVHLPFRPRGNVEAYQLYLARFARRDELLAHLNAQKIEAKVHYPVPLHLQKAASSLGYKRGDFPKAERDANELITLPNHQFVSAEQIQFMVDTITDFYAR